MKFEHKKEEELQARIDELTHQLYEANETIEAIRTGQVDALVVESENGHQVFTLKTSDVAYRVFIEKMTEGAVTLNKDGIILYSNSQFAVMVNKTLDNVIGASFETFVSTEYKDSFKDIFDKSWNEDVKGEAELNSGGDVIPVQLSLAKLEFDDVTSLSMIVTDLATHKDSQKQLKEFNDQLAQTNKQLESSNNDLQQFASVASHDLQEPLRKILIFSDLLNGKGSFNNVPDAQHYLDKVISSARRMKTLIIDVLSYSKLSTNHEIFQKCDLNKILSDILEDFELAIEEKKGKIIIDKLPKLDVNAGQISQVFQNLISNALKFVKPNVPPVISIRSKCVAEKSFTAAEQKEGPYCQITIQDNGIGFDEKYITKIFAIFERFHLKDGYEGTGIGLAIAKKIIEKHNGLISARSTVGVGSEFILLLPVRQNGVDNK